MHAIRPMMANVWKIIIFFLVSISVNAQERNEWTANDSVRLSKMLNGEIPIHIDDALKKEIEQSIIGHSIKDNNRHWDDFSLDIYFKKISPDVVNMDCNTVSHYKSRYNSNLLNENPKCNSIIINSRTDKNLPFINVQQNTNIAIPLNDKWNFDLYGGYTQYKRNSVIIPPTAIPYNIGGGFSYNVGKNMFIGTQTDYQYNILQKKWEWFCGLRFTINF